MTMHARSPELYIGPRCASCGGDHHADATDAKTCPRCGYLQIMEAYPMHTIRGRRRRSSWCRACWDDHRAEQRAAR